MRSTRETVVAAVALVAVYAIIAHCTPGCSPAEITKEAAAGAYEAQQMRCVEQYAHKADIDRCRMRVKLEWATRDAGADQ